MKKIIPSLNGLRAISIFIVLFSHMNIMNFSGSLARHTHLLDGQFGVTVFFIISGFLITTLLMAEEARTGMISLQNFYVKRVLRIFPVYFLMLLVYGLLQSLGFIHFDLVSWLTSLTYTKDFNWNTDWEMAHLWSLSIEEQFYLFWPLIFIYWKKNRVKFAFSIVMLAPACRILGTMVHHRGFDELSIFQRSDAIMWGCIFAIYHERILAFIQEKVAKRKWLLIVPFASLFALDGAIQLNHIFNLHMGFLIVPFGNLTSTFGCLIIATIVIISIHYNNNIWFRFLNTKLLNYIGTLSYSIYIWQQMFFSHKLGMFHSIPVNIVMIFITAICSYHIIEKPFLKLKKQVNLPEATDTYVNPWIANLSKYK